MKPINPEDFWRYRNLGNASSKVFKVDGVFRLEGDSVGYLGRKYNMSVKEAYEYLRGLPNL